MTDIEIAASVEAQPIVKVAQKLGLIEDDLELYGKYKAKINVKPAKGTDNLVLVTAINPTSLGEGKTTTAIGLADGMAKIGKKVCLALREPSLGPVFGIKGGATGGGRAQVIPMEDINLHFTGDLHAITCANNLIAAILDNSLQQGNPLDIDPTRVVWKRCLDMNDRALRSTVIGLGGHSNGVPRQDGFNITAASEIMAVLCLAADMKDLKRRVGNIVVAYSRAGEPVTCADLGVVDAVAIVLKDAIKPNLVQTLEHTPAIVHGGPFANIAHGCNSVIATRTALKLGDYVVTEAGFGADLGAEKFLDIKCRIAGLRPAAVVVVATVRALKMHGGLPKNALAEENLAALREGIPNLLRHVRNMKEVYGLPAVVAVNRFPTDTDEEIGLVMDACKQLGVNVVLSTVWAEGGKGGEELAREVVRLCEEKSDFQFCYDEKLPIKEKIRAIVTKVYGGKAVAYTPEADAEIARLEALGFAGTPVCMAKTQYSFSDDATRLGAPEGFTVTVRSVKISAGAGFVVALTGNILTMPGLPPVPAAERIDVDETGKITGLF